MPRNLKIIFGTDADAEVHQGGPGERNGFNYTNT